MNWISHIFDISLTYSGAGNKWHLSWGGECQPKYDERWSGGEEEGSGLVKCKRWHHTTYLGEGGQPKDDKRWFGGVVWLIKLPKYDDISGRGGGTISSIFFQKHFFCGGRGEVQMGISLQIEIFLTPKFWEKEPQWVFKWKAFLITCNIQRTVWSLTTAPWISSPRRIEGDATSSGV